MCTCVSFIYMKDRFLPRHVEQRVNFFFGLKELLDIPMENLELPTVQQSFLHEQALITRHEVMGLLCKHFLLPKTPVTYSSMNELGWHFAQKLIRQDGKKFWATDTRFPYGGLRRDNLRIHWLHKTQLSLTWIELRSNSSSI